MATKLIYQMFVKLLSWIVLRARSDTTKRSRSSSYGINSPCCSDAHPGPGSAGATAP